MGDYRGGPYEHLACPACFGWSPLEVWPNTTAGELEYHGRCRSCGAEIGIVEARRLTWIDERGFLPECDPGGARPDHGEGTSEGIESPQTTRASRASSSRGPKS